MLAFDRHSRVKFFTHLIVISMLFILPEVIMNYSMPRRHAELMWGVYFKAFLYMIVFYTNYYLIIPRTIEPPKRKILAFVSWNILLVLVAVIVNYIGWYLLFPEHRMFNKMFSAAPLSRMLMIITSFMLRDMVMFILTIALSVAMKLSEGWDFIEKHKQQLEASQQAEELDNLKSQLNPHFLFNTLNTIYALIAVSPTEAQDAVHRLSKLLRYVLYENPAMVKLSAEIDFARNYIALMENRLPAGSVETEFASEAESDVYVPPLLFIVLIENAFKHGNAARGTEPIRIAITRGSDGSIVCRTRNRFAKHVEELGREEVGKTSKLPNTQTSHLPNSHTTNLPNSPKGGIGISNLRRRLHLIYGDAASLETKADGDIYTATLTIHTKKSLS